MSLKVDIVELLPTCQFYKADRDILSHAHHMHAVIVITFCLYKTQKESYYMELDAPDNTLHF